MVLQKVSRKLAITDNHTSKSMYILHIPIKSKSSIYLPRSGTASQASSGFIADKLSKLTSLESIPGK